MQNILLKGLQAGAISGLIWGILLILFISPLILEAEKYENNPVAQQQTAAVHQHQHEHAHGGATASTEFEPNTWQRPLLTVIGTILLGVACGAIVSLILFLGLKYKLWETSIFQHPLRNGILFAICAFVILQLIPGLGLPPPLPGVVNAHDDVVVRQYWYGFAIISGFIGFIGFFYLKSRALIKKQSAWYVYAIIWLIFFLILPFIVGVPTHSEISTAPEILQHKFILSGGLINGIFWIIFSILMFYSLRKN